MTGRADAPTSGVHTFTVNHSSDDVRRIGCGGGDPNSSALNTPSHGSWGTGAAKRSGPTGGCAYGIPRKACTPSCRVPRTYPVCVATIVTQRWWQASGFLAGNDDDDDQRQDAEEQPQDSPSDRVSPLHGGHHAADVAAMMLPIATKMPLMPRRMR